MNIIERAKILRPLIEKAAGLLEDTDAINGWELFPAWKSGKTYTTGERIGYSGKLYRVIQNHTSQDDWTPDKAVSLFVEITDPSIEWPEWKQPTGAHDAYNKGDKVSYHEKHWISQIDANVYSPETYGWVEA